MNFILVHGSWHGQWCWQKIAPLLQAQGHHVITPDLPGHGNNVDRATCPPLKSIKLSHYVDTVAHLLEQVPESAVLVGHSMGGAVISQVAEKMPDKIAKLVYIAAYLPIDGETLLQADDYVKRPCMLSATSLINYNKTDQTLVLSADTLRHYFYHDCSPDTVEWALAYRQAEPYRPYFDKLDLSTKNLGGLPKIYLVCVADRVLIRDAQMDFARRAGCDTLSVESGHSPFLSQPEEITALLATI